MKGKLIRLSVPDMDKIQCDNKIFAVRSCKNSQYFIDKGWQMNKDLSPSKQLFYKCQGLKKQNNWNKQSFDNIYRPLFHDEMNFGKMNKELNIVKDLIDNGEDVAIMCYCPDKELCHVGMIGEVFEEIGIEVLYM